VQEVGETRRLLRQPVGGYKNDVTGDGQKILASVAPEQGGGPQPLTIVLNWAAALKK
jgi:hypothetical protein